MASPIDRSVEQGSFTYGNESIGYRITRSPTLVSRVRVHVRPDATVELECPPNADTGQIQDVLARRARWIWRNLAEVRAGKRHAQSRTYVTGETHFYLGRRHQLRVISDKAIGSSVRLHRGRLEVCLPVADPVAVKRRLEAWYRKRAEEYLGARLRIVCGEIPWVNEVPDMSLLRMRAQWGNCSPDGKLTLNPALIKAPRPCIDYVLKHEICHLLEHNHGPKFYALLDRCAPQWRADKADLDRLAELLLAGI